ncbi:MAG: TPM domain-containing protein [Bacteriovoracia bacterium]
MLTGKSSKIQTAIEEAQAQALGEIRVHISSRRFERDPLRSAQNLFRMLKLDRSGARNGVLIYVNQRRRKLAVVADFVFMEAVGPRYLDDLCTLLRNDLNCTHIENALAMAVRVLGITLQKHFPRLEA